MEQEPEEPVWCRSVGSYLSLAKVGKLAPTPGKQEPAGLRELGSGRRQMGTRAVEFTGLDVPITWRSTHHKYALLTYCMSASKTREEIKRARTETLATQHELPQPPRVPDQLV